MGSRRENAAWTITAQQQTRQISPSRHHQQRTPERSCGCPRGCLDCALAKPARGELEREEGKERRAGFARNRLLGSSWEVPRKFLAAQSLSAASHIVPSAARAATGRAESTICAPTAEPLSSSPRAPTAGAAATADGGGRTVSYAGAGRRLHTRPCSSKREALSVCTHVISLFSPAVRTTASFPVAV